jgi:hypothetical protein
VSCPKRNHSDPICAVGVLLCFLSSVAWAQGEGADVRELLKDDILSPAVAEFQIRQYLIQNTATLPKPPATAQEWTATATRLRRHLLDDVVFHGWPKEWIKSAPKFEESGVIATGDGYRIHRLRCQIVPGFESSALLYEPEHVDARAPAILNLAGHDGPLGYAYEFKQKRCINFAKHGILALNLERFGFGELGKTGNEHWFAAHLDMVGANGLGVFYLEMRRGLDKLPSRCGPLLHVEDFLHHSEPLTGLKTRNRLKILGHLCLPAQVHGISRQRVPGRIKILDSHDQNQILFAAKN